MTGGTYKRSQQIVSLRGLQVLPVKLYADGLIMILQESEGLAVAVAVAFDILSTAL